MQAKLINVGSETACILPKEVLERLHVKEGDTLEVTETADGVVLTADEQFNKKMELVDDSMRRYDNTLRELAK